MSKHQYDLLTHQRDKEHLGTSIDEDRFAKDLLKKDHIHDDSDSTGRLLSGEMDRVSQDQDSAVADSALVGNEALGG